MNTFKLSDCEIQNKEVMYEGVFRMVRYALRFRLFQGGWSNTVCREVMERRSAVGILPYDPVLDEIILIEQFRPGPLSHSSSPWLFEIVAGVFDGSESPEEVAEREMIEETGSPLLDLYPIYAYFVSPGGCNEYLHLFCGCVNAAEVAGIHGLAEEGENIRTIRLPFSEALTWLKQGHIQTAPAIVTLQWLQLNREWLRTLWLNK